MSNSEIASMLFLQIAAILAACHALAWVLKRFGQPPVVAEMIAGVALGPSLLGYLAPGAAAWLFPGPSMPVISAFAQFALALYMFLVGAEFRMDIVRPKARSAAAVSIAGMIVPFALGAGLALVLAQRPDMFGPAVTPSEAALFLGTAMCITAFPVLARIIQEGGLFGTSVGTLALAAGALGDAAAWGILAVVLAIQSGQASSALLAIGGGAAFIALALLVLRPGLKLIAARAERAGTLDLGKVAAIAVVLLLCCAFTEWVGLHAVFGAFVVGAILPRGVLTREMSAKIAPLVSVVLLPLYFVYSGLNTQLTLVNTPALSLLALAVLAVACIGKGLGCAAAARLSGEPPREALAIGALMNARGLMELIILNIGLERGIISPALFSIMVLMTAVTTLLATPAFRLAMTGLKAQENQTTPAQRLPEAHP